MQHCGLLDCNGPGAPSPGCIILMPLPLLPPGQVVKYLCEMINKKDKKANVKPFMAKNYLWVFVNCLIENPAFDSQVGKRIQGRMVP